MPLIGYGTYQTPPSITERRVADALKVGYRSIDTAQCYGNEHEVGLACRKSGIPREELFIPPSCGPVTDMRIHCGRLTVPCVSWAWITLTCS